jgi:hypothetical protein
MTYPLQNVFDPMSSVPELLEFASSRSALALQLIESSQLADPCDVKPLTTSARLFLKDTCDALAAIEARAAAASLST